MALFKTVEEKRREMEEKTREEENHILQKKRFFGQVGFTPQGTVIWGGYAAAPDNKVKFRDTRFNIYDDKIFIVRTKTVINFSDIKEIFQENQFNAVIVLNSGDGIPIKGKNSRTKGIVGLKAFVNVLNSKIKDYEPDNSIQSNNEVKDDDDEMDNLIKLGEMYEKGLLTDEEFAEMKQNIINNKN